MRGLGGARVAMMVMRTAYRATQIAHALRIASGGDTAASRISSRGLPAGPEGPAAFSWPSRRDGQEKAN